MEDTATELLVENIKELLVNRPGLTKDDETRGNIENLLRDLPVFIAFLRETVEKRRRREMAGYYEEDSSEAKRIAKEVQDVVYDVQDMIDVLIAKTIEKNQKTRFFRFWDKAGSLNATCKHFEEVKAMVDRFREKTIIYVEDERIITEAQPPKRKDAEIPEVQKEELVHRLSCETDYLDVIPLIDTTGCGMQILARQIFNEQHILYKFPTRIWLTITYSLTAEQMCIDILKELSIRVDEDTSAKELADTVAARLHNQTFLIVMDNVDISDWERLSVALPFHNTKGKVLITTYDSDVKKVDRNPNLFTIYGFATDEDVWGRLRWEALGKLDCPPELVDVGQEIAFLCARMPKTVSIIGRILESYSVTDRNIKYYWIKVRNQLRSYTHRMPSFALHLSRFIYLSYDNIPHHLRPCLLYFLLFPKHHEILVSKLIRLWITEGFVQQQSGCSLEETGEKYLYDLISRKLVVTVRFKSDGKLKSCQIHDTLLEYDNCPGEANEEYFLQEIVYKGDGQCEPPLSSKETCRRLSIHSDCLSFVSSRPFGPRVRSFVCFSKTNYVVSPENSTNITEAFKLVRVLDILPLKFTKIDSDLYNLFHLRYIAFSSELSILPSKFNQLWNIQTLIVITKSRTLQVKADIWKMKRLRHFKTNASATLPVSVNSDKQSTELQTLGLISVESCTEELPHQAPNLKKLGIRGRLALLFGRKTGSIDSLKEMRKLGKLKLVNDIYPDQRREGALGCLPRYDQFPCGLTSLTICATFLGWEHMSTLGLLEKLEVLKLRDHAFVGHTWEVEDGGFHSLETMHIEKTDLACWKASSHHYPKLRSLVLKDCDKLREIPVQLADISSFETLELSTSRSAVTSAKTISKLKRDGGSEFTLFIFPRHHTE
ncbi:putative late blight resistance protein homolog R1C-3 [Salvia hispanica]|uniref:putative late blight resistance protein homolog R1C-3 n=1 Tax=Salvia hispanica TaxID=49212 RepID=UPI002009BA99|nr:putative late blight resistance protein homolog R1C-3 [Salvia hispanica]